MLNLGCWLSAVLSQNVCGPASSVVAWAERLAEGDRVSLGVGDFGFSEATRLGFNRSDGKPAFLQFSDVAVEVVHQRVSKAVPARSVSATT